MLWVLAQRLSGSGTPLDIQSASLCLGMISSTCHGVSCLERLKAAGTSE